MTHEELLAQRDVLEQKRVAVRDEIRALNEQIAAAEAEELTNNPPPPPPPGAKPQTIGAVLPQNIKP